MSHKYEEMTDVMSFWIEGSKGVRSRSAHEDRCFIVYEYDKDDKVVGVEWLSFRRHFLSEWRTKWKGSEERKKLPTWLQLETDRVLLQTKSWSPIAVLVE